MLLLRLFSLLIVISTSLFAQSAVNITGKVTTEAGAGLAGVDIRLTIGKLQTTSLTDGNYALTGTVGIHRNAKGIKSGNLLQYKTGLLIFRQTEALAQVSIDLLDVKGIRLKQLLNKQLSHGTYQFGIKTSGLSAQMYIVRATMNRQVIQIPVSLVAYTNSTLLTRIGDAQSTTLAKTTAVIDTLTLRLLGYGVTKVPIESYTGLQNVILKALSTWNGDTAAFWGPRGKDIPLPKNAMIYKFLNRTNGAYPDDSVFWEFNGTVKSLAEQDMLDMPVGSSGRVNFYLGKRKTGARYFDFIEHTITADKNTFHGNTTRVDWYGFPIALRLHGLKGEDELLGEHYSVFYMGRKKFFDTFKAEVPEKFRHLAEVDGDKWIVCPASGQFKNNGTYKDYFTAYVDSVWIKQKRTGAKPTLEEIFRCSGPMGGDPQMCAALNRHTAMLDPWVAGKPWAGTQWDTTKFYQAEPSNHYAAFLHRYAFRGKAYGFAYDDVTNMAAYAELANPHYLLVAIGF